ncbi:unnamed protein product [Symbiodinium sp. CCMP2592]|nr:unnamed protein product [Symbiodinium sp. CCMP2592]
MTVKEVKEKAKGQSGILAPSIPQLQLEKAWPCRRTLKDTDMLESLKVESGNMMHLAKSQPSAGGAAATPAAATTPAAAPTASAATPAATPGATTGSGKPPPKSSVKAKAKLVGFQVFPEKPLLQLTLAARLLSCFTCRFFKIFGASALAALIWMTGHTILVAKASLRLSFRTGEPRPGM